MQRIQGCLQAMNKRQRTSEETLQDISFHVSMHQANKAFQKLVTCNVGTEQETDKLEATRAALEQMTKQAQLVERSYAQCHADVQRVTLALSKADGQVQSMCFFLNGYLSAMSEGRGEEGTAFLMNMALVLCHQPTVQLEARPENCCKARG
eukprot:3938814-Rhodomonas_salina.2